MVLGLVHFSSWGNVHTMMMTNQRGFIDPISLAAIAFVIFVAVMAVGIAVDRWVHETPCDPAVQTCSGQEP